jgi:uncharacterized protein (DUF1778 family)
MSKDPKTEQLQIRVSPSQKRAIRKRAKAARMSVSEWILNVALPSAQTAFQSLLAELAAAQKPSFAFAELLEWIDSLSAEAFEQAVVEPPRVRLDPYWESYLAATIEHAAVLKRARCPGWTRDVPPLEKPVFGSSLRSLKLHLLVHSPPPFIQRNIFIDSSVGGRV